MKTNPNDSIHLSPDVTHDGRIIGTDTGLTKREYFAAMAMQGLIMKNGEGHLHFEGSELAVQMADALINALNK